MLNKAREIMKQRESMIKEAHKVLEVLNASEVKAEQIVKVTINKGKIVEVPVVKETVKTTKDTKEIESLTEQLNELDKNYEVMASKYEELQAAYDQLAKDYENRCERIEELKDEIEVKQAIITNLNDQLKAQESVTEMYKLRAERKQQTIYVEDEVFEEETVEEEVVVEETKEEKPAKNYYKQVDMGLYDVHKTHDGIKGRTDNYEFVWSFKHKLPAYRPIGGTNADYKPMTGPMYAEAKYIMNNLRNFMNQVKETKAKKATSNKPAEKTVTDEQEIDLNKQTNETKINRQMIGKKVTVSAAEIFGDADPLAGADEYDFY